MPNNPITDKTLGTVGTYDHGGYKEIRRKAGLAPEEPVPHSKSKKPKPPPATYLDYPVGMTLIVVRKDRNGFVGHLVVKVIDSFGRPPEASGWRTSSVMIAVEQTEFKAHEWMVGHIFDLELDRRGWFGSKDNIRVATMSQSEFQKNKSIAKANELRNKV